MSQHLRVLKGARLVAVRQDGNRRIYRVDPTGIGDLRSYLDRFWDTALLAFKQRAESSPVPVAGGVSSDHPSDPTGSSSSEGADR